MAQTTEMQRLPWKCVAPVPRAVEDQLLAVVVLSKKEIGMMRAQPRWRIDAVSEESGKLDIPMETALSLRRHHMKIHEQVPHQHTASARF